MFKFCGGNEHSNNLCLLFVADIYDSLAPARPPPDRNSPNFKGPIQWEKGLGCFTLTQGPWSGGGKPSTCRHTPLCQGTGGMPLQGIPLVSQGRKVLGCGAPIMLLHSWSGHIVQVQSRGPLWGFPQCSHSSNVEGEPFQKISSTCKCTSTVRTQRLGPLSHRIGPHKHRGQATQSPSDIYRCQWSKSAVPWHIAAQLITFWRGHLFLSLVSSV